MIGIDKSLGFHISACIYFVLLALTEFIRSIFYTTITDKLICLVLILCVFFWLSKQINIVIEKIKENKK